MGEKLTAKTVKFMPLKNLYNACGIRMYVLLMNSYIYVRIQ